MIENPEMSIILPCLNEGQVIGSCLRQIGQVVREHNLNAEIIIVDNGSSDGSREIVREEGRKIGNAKLVYEPRRGYGSAYLKGISIARGKYIFMADSDGSYDFNEIPKFIAELKKRGDLIIGNRFKGEMEKGAMSFSHKYIGNPILSGILRLFFKVRVQDTHSGMRAITKKALDKLNLRAIGMEFASEMIIKAGKNKLKIKELPIEYHKRRGRSKLKTWGDGWRHLRFMLLYSPFFLFFIPGLVLFLLGIGSMAWLYFGQPEIFGISFQFHPMFLSALLIMVGYQLIIFSLFAKTYAITHLGDKPVFDGLYRHITIEKASLVGILLIVVGAIIYITIFAEWLRSGFGELQEVKNSILALTLIVMGIQTIFSSFMLSILGIKGK